MTKYTVSINFEDAALEQLYAADFEVIVARLGFIEEATPTIWCAIRPMQSIQIDWDDAMYLFASETQVQNGADIRMMAVTDAPVQTGLRYTLTQDATFTAQPGGEPGMIMLSNSFGRNVTIGLAQSCELQQERTPMFGLTLPPNMNAELTRSNNFSIWVNNGARSGTLNSEIPESALEVQMSDQNANTVLGFDNATRRFYVAQS